MKNSKSTIANKSVKGSTKKVLNTEKIESANVISMELAIIPKQDAPAQDAPKMSKDTLDMLNAINVSKDIVKSAERKTIFKKEFNNKKDRTKCRTKFINAVELFILQLQKDKMEQALEYLEIVKSTAKHYYNAEDSFNNYLDYCSENMDENKKNVIKAFIVAFADLRQETIISE